MNIRSKLFWLFVILAIFYVLTNIIAAPPRTSLQHYHLTTSTLRALNFSVTGPVVAVWFIGLYGYQKLTTYTGYIRTNKDGQQIERLNKGLLFLTLWLPLNSTVSSVLNSLGQHFQGSVPVIAIILNYLGLLIPLVGFFYLSRGARGLSEIVKQRPGWASMNGMTVLLILIGVFYAYAASQSHGTLSAMYHMPVSLVLLTIVVPYIFTWYLGLFAAYELHLYTYKVKGVIYRHGWNLLAVGVSWIILFSIVLQYITVVTARFIKLPLGGLLALLYGVVATLAIGYICVARGAQKLTKIEEV